MKWSQFKRANSRRHQLIDKLFLVGLTTQENNSLTRVGKVVDRANEKEFRQWREKQHQQKG